MDVEEAYQEMPNLKVMLADMLEGAQSETRFSLLLIAVFAGVAVLMAGVGLDPTAVLREK